MAERIIQFGTIYKRPEGGEEWIVTGVGKGYFYAGRLDRETGVSTGYGTMGPEDIGQIVADMDPEEAAEYLRKGYKQQFGVSPPTEVEEEIRKRMLKKPIKI